ncbi:helix-turn-helix transcriptional regulator [Actinocrispum wychmicini]|uniref:AraC-like DNA-binding protein n=1 Tax=Actinocrispum wychmicini TaxID=1213861 RepID=A0A4R2J8T3_9PSEU|nr:AraC family transcriptional regulator [Actinocrispum wychmicini]TCO52958.1 AraC-like DNA-binding protein [Actinocrispum wychmicini]
MGQNVVSGHLVVRSSGTDAVLAAINGTAARERVQLLMHCPVRAGDVAFADCALQASHDGVVMLAVAAARLSIAFGELRPLMFQPVEVSPALRELFANAVAQVLSAREALDPHGLSHYLIGLANLVLRSALRAELDRVDTLAVRRREAMDYIREHLSEPSLGADRVADALFISRRRLYQLFDDGQGVSERIRGMRLERAKNLLTDPAKASQGIAGIAKDCGFVNATHFSRTFRKVVGQTPRQFRETAR